MEIANYDIQKLLKSLYGRVIGIGKATYTSNRPKATAEGMDDFIVVSAPHQLVDRLALGNTTCYVALFVKDRKGGSENLTRATQMQKAVYALFPFEDDSYMFRKPQIVASGADGNGFHIYTISIKTIIKAI